VQKEPKDDRGDGWILIGGSARMYLGFHVHTRKENTDDGNGCWRADMVSVMRTGEGDGHAPTTREDFRSAYTPS
jgi:hypothetical protein